MKKFMKWLMPVMLMLGMIGVPEMANAERFLTFPFSEQRAVQQGWVYTGGGTHDGIDYLCPENTPILAAADGVAMWSQQSSDLSIGYGRFVLVRHDNGFFTLYAHLNSAAAGVPNKAKTATDYSNWKRVSRGEVIAYSGNTGRSTAPHLHFELSSGYAVGKRDPYDIYRQAANYPPRAGTSCGANHSWTTDPPSLHRGDTAPPTVTITSGHPTGAATYTTPQRISWRISDNGGSGIAGWGQGWDGDPGSNQFTTSDGYLDLPSGTHILHVHTRDNAGNERDWTFGPYTYDPYESIGRGSSEKIHFVDCFIRNGEWGTVGNPSNNTYWWGTTNPVVRQDYAGGSAGEGALIDNEGVEHTTAYWMHGAIWHNYRDLGGPDSELKRPKSDEVNVATDRYVQDFEGGSFYSWPRGTFYVYGKSKTSYDATGSWGGHWGWPIGNRTALDQVASPQGTFGGVQWFENGYCYDSSHGAFLVSGVIATKYGNYGGAEPSWERGFLGYPISNSYSWCGGTRQDFEGGSLTDGVTLSLTLNPASVNSGANATGTVSLSGAAPSGGVTVNLSSSDNSVATVPATVNVPEGAVSATFTINALSGTNSATAIISARVADLSAQATLSVNASLPAISINDARRAEGNEGTAHHVFTVTLSRTSTQTVTVGYASSNGSAVQPEDYTPVSGTLSFAPGQTSKTVIVEVKGDIDFEADETLFLNLSNPANAALERARGTAIIVNDDPAPPDWQAVDLATGSDNLTRLLWTRSDNAFSAWLINADHRTYTSTPRYGPITNWKASNISVGGDGKRRILLNRNDKAAAVWTVDAQGGVVSSPLFDPSGFACRDIATAQNNTSRLLWVRGDEAFALWLLGTTNKFSSTPLYGPIPGWKPQAIGVGGDSKTRVLMVNGGQAAVWTVTVDATGNFSSTPAYAPTGFGCRHMAVGSDSKPRLLWVRGDEAFAVWTLDSAGNIKSTPLYGPIPGWKSRAISVGADGKTRVLLNRHDGQAAVWILDDAGNISSTPGYGPFQVGTRSMQLPAKVGPAPTTTIKGPAPSPIVLSTAEATPSQNGTITLRFSGALDAKSASDGLRYTVTVNGTAQALSRATCQGESVTLHLNHSLQDGDEVRVWWRDLRDDANCTLSGSTDVLVAR